MRLRVISRGYVVTRKEVMPNDTKAPEPKWITHELIMYSDMQQAPSISGREVVRFVDLANGEPYGPGSWECPKGFKVLVKGFKVLVHDPSDTVYCAHDVKDDGSAILGSDQ
jgi:hypothetical protein